MPTYRSHTRNGLTISLEIGINGRDELANTSNLYHRLMVEADSEVSGFTTGDYVFIDLRTRNSADTGFLSNRVWSSRNQLITTPSNSKSRQLSVGSVKVNHDTYGLFPVLIRVAFKVAVVPGLKETDLSFTSVWHGPPIKRGPAIFERVGSWTNRYWMTRSYVKVGGVWRDAIPYVKVDDKWEPAGGDGFNIKESGYKWG